MNAALISPKHPDAVGYLTDLANEVNEPWFKMVCDLAAASGVSSLDQLTRDTLIALYTKKASYLAITPAAGATAGAAAPTAPADALEQLSGFTNFKLLGDTLDVSFKRRITLIFGANGSGKSSLCESLKALATPETPNRPLQNLRAAGAANPEFRYKFTSDAAHHTWTPAIGYGPKQATVKYFDTAIAIGNVKSAVDPGRVIELTPFKLHVFDRAKALTTSFREVLQQAQRENSEKQAQSLKAIRTDFAAFTDRPLAVINDTTCAVLPDLITLGQEFADQELLRAKQVAAAELAKAASDEGLKLLRAEYRELELFLADLNTLLTSASDLWALEPAIKVKALAEKKVAQEALAKALVPTGGTLERLLTLLRAASPMCNLDEAEGHACPLCKRDLAAPEIELFKRYYNLLAGELETEITALKTGIDNANNFATAFHNVDRDAWDKFTTIPEDVVIAAKSSVDIFIADCDVSREATGGAKTALESLKASATVWASHLEAKKIAVDTATNGRENLVRQLGKLGKEIEPLEYARTIAEHLESLRKAHGIAEESQFWRASLPAFTQVLRKITERAKYAHEELVVFDFEARLNREYRALAEKDMAAFGVTLARRGADAAVTVLPQVGGKDIEGVLSEGEQRVHALALFFAELDSCSQSVLVFDDPVSSFDYNYIANYCARLRDVAQQHTNRQIIVLTHNWEFFVQLQTTLSQAGLDPHLSVQILENCAVVADYSEKIDDLKKDIEAILAAAGEPLKAQKEAIAGKMRRLIESVVNTHVFNHQRHQFKQKSQAITAFQSFTKVVALLPAEATTLRDIYAKLSITEHDDPRTAYVNTDKAMFQTRYDQIAAVEAAIVGRK